MTSPVRTGLLSKTQEAKDDESTLPHIHPHAAPGSSLSDILNEKGLGDAIDAAALNEAGGKHGPMSGAPSKKKSGTKHNHNNVDVEGVLSRLDESFRMQQLEQQAMMRRAYRHARTANPEQLAEMNERLDQQIHDAKRRKTVVKKKMKQKLQDGSLAEKELALLAQIPKAEVQQQVTEQEIASQYISDPKPFLLKMEPEEGDIVALRSTRLQLGNVFDAPPEIDPEAQRRAVLQVMSEAKDLAHSATERAVHHVRLDATVHRVLRLAVDQSADLPYSVIGSDDTIADHHHMRRHEAERAVIKLRQTTQEAINQAFACEERVRKAHLEVLDAETETKKVASRALAAEEDLRRVTKKALAMETDLDQMRTMYDSTRTEYSDFQVAREKEIGDLRTTFEGKIETVQTKMTEELETCRSRAREELEAKTLWADEEIVTLKTRVREAEADAERAHRRRVEVEEESQNMRMLLEARMKTSVQQLELEKQRLRTEGEETLEKRVSEMEQQLRNQERSSAKELESVRGRLQGELDSAKHTHEAERLRLESQAKEAVELLNSKHAFDMDTMKNRYDTEVNRLKVEIQNLESRASTQLEAEKTMGAATIGKWTSRAATAEEDLEKFRAQADAEAERQKKAKAQELQEANERTLAVEEEMDAYKRAMQEEIGQLQAKAAENVEELSLRAHEAEEKLQQTADRLMDSEGEVKKLRRELREVIPMTHQKTADLKNLVAQQKAVLDQLRDQKSTAHLDTERQEEMNNLQKMLASQRELIEKLQSREGEAQLAKVQAESMQRTTELESQLKESNTSLFQLRKQHDATLEAQLLMASELQELQTFHENDKAVVAKLKATIKAHEAEISQLQTVRGSQNVEINRLRAAQDENMEAEGFSTVELNELRVENAKLQEQARAARVEVVQERERHETAMEGSIADMETAYHSRLTIATKAQDARIEELESRLKGQIAQKEQLRQRCERMRHDHAAEIDELLQEQALQLSIHEEREQEYQQHEQDLQDKLMELADTYSQLKQKTMQASFAREERGTQTFIELDVHSTQTVALNTSTAQASQTVVVNSVMSTVGTQLERPPVAMDSPWDLCSMDGSSVGEHTAATQQRQTDAEPSRQPSTSSPRVVTRHATVSTSTSPLQAPSGQGRGTMDSPNEMGVKTQSMPQDHVGPAKGVQGELRGVEQEAPVPDGSTVDGSTVGSEAHETSRTIDLPATSGGPGTAQGNAPTAQRDAQHDARDVQLEVPAQNSAASEVDEGHASPQVTSTGDSAGGPNVNHVVSAFVGSVLEEVATTTVGDSATVAAAQELQKVAQPHTMSVTERHEDQSVGESERRSDFAGAVVHDIMGSVAAHMKATSIVPETPDIIHAHLENPVETSRMLYRGCLEIDRLRYIVRMIHLRETGTVLVDLFDPVHDAAESLTFSAEQWSASGITSVADLSHDDKKRLVRWLCNDRLHSLKHSQHAVVFRGMLLLQDSSRCIVTVASDARAPRGDEMRREDISSNDHDVLLGLVVHTFMPASGETGSIRVPQEQCHAFGLMSTADAEDAAVLALVSHVLEEHGITVATDPSRPVAVFNANLAIAGTEFHAEANFQEHADHPLQLLFREERTGRRHELQLSRAAWRVFKKGHDDVSTAAANLCRDFVTLGEAGQVVFKQVTSPMNWEVKAPTSPIQTPSSPDVPEQPKQSLIRATAKAGKQVCSASIEIHDDRVQIQLQSLQTGQTGDVTVPEGTIRALGLDDLYATSRAERQAAAKSLVSMLRIKPDGSLVVDDQRTGPDLDDRSVHSAGSRQSHAASVESELLTHVSWEGFDGIPEMGESKEPCFLDIARTVDIQGTKVLLKARRLPDGVQLEVDMQEEQGNADRTQRQQEARPLHVSRSTWTQLGLDDLWSAPDDHVDNLFADVASMVHRREDGSFVLDPFYDVEVTSDESRVTHIERHDRFFKAKMSQGETMLIKFDTSSREGVRIRVNTIPSDCPNPIAATLSFSSSDAYTAEYWIPKEQVAYEGYGELWDSGDEFMQTNQLRLAKRLVTEDEGRKLRVALEF